MFALITSLMSGNSDYLIFAYFLNIHLERGVKCKFVMTSCGYLHKKYIWYFLWFVFFFLVLCKKKLFILGWCAFFGKQQFHQFI